MKFLGIILSLILLINIIPSNVFAKESGRNITDTELVSWDISPAGGTIKEGDRIEVSVSWEDTADMSIQKDDYILIEWTTEADGASGYFDETLTGEYDIVDTQINKVVATLTISDGQAVIKFNENVDGRDDHKGSASFEIEGRHQDSESEKIPEIVIGSESEKITINEREGSGAGGEKDDFSKTGSQQEDGSLRWRITINETGSTNWQEKIVIEDTLGIGHEPADPETDENFMIEYRKADGRQWTAYQGYEAAKELLGEGSIVKKEGNKLYIEFSPEVITNPAASIRIIYYTKLTKDAENLEQVSNNAVITGTRDGNEYMPYKSRNILPNIVTNIPPVNGKGGRYFG